MLSCLFLKQSQDRGTIQPGENLIAVDKSAIKRDINEHSVVLCSRRRFSL